MTASTSKAVLATVAIATVFGMLAPTTALADGMDWGYTDVYSQPTGGTDWGYTDVGYYDTQPNTNWGYTDVGYYDTSGYDYAPYYSSGSYDYAPYYSSGSYDYAPYYSSSYYPSSYSYNTPSYNYSYPSYSYSQPYTTHTYSYDYVYDYTYESYDNNDHHNNDLDCELTASDRSIEEGDDTTLRWTVDGNANYASINQGVGRVDEDGGSERVSPDEDTTYRLTVRDSHDNEATCSVSISVDQGDRNFSSVTFVGDDVRNPPVVYLSSIPYTGLEDIDPTLLTYWALLIAAAGAGVWALYRKGLIPHFAFASADGEATEGDVETETPATENPAVASFLTALAENRADAALDEIRLAAARGESVEDFLAEAELAATDADLQARVNQALEAAKQTGIRGAKAVLA